MSKYYPCANYPSKKQEKKIIQKKYVPVHRALAWYHIFCAMFIHRCVNVNFSLTISKISKEREKNKEKIINNVLSCEAGALNEFYCTQTGKNMNMVFFAVDLVDLIKKMR